MTPFCQRRPDESIAAWHRRIHDTAHDWRDVAELLVLRGLHDEAKMVTSVAHLRREERTVALLGVAEERDKDADLLIVGLLVRRDGIGVVSCGVVCVFSGSGPCDCRAPTELHRLRQRTRALRWAAEALMRPEPVWECSGCGTEARGTFPKDWVHVFAGEDVCPSCQVEHTRTESRLMPPPAGEKDIVDRLQDAIDAANRHLGPSAETLADAARVCLLDAREEPHEGEKRHLKKLADQMIERAGGLARSAAEVRR